MLTKPMASLNTAVDHLLGERRKLEQAIASNDPSQIKTTLQEFNKQLHTVRDCTNELATQSLNTK